MYYILFYTTVKDYEKKRKPYRQSHLTYAGEAQQRGELILGGALTDPMDSAVLIFKADSPETAAEFARNDPYVQNGLIRQWEVRQWDIAIGTELV